MEQPCGTDARTDRRTQRLQRKPGQRPLNAKRIHGSKTTRFSRRAANRFSTSKSVLARRCFSAYTRQSNEFETEVGLKKLIAIAVLTFLIAPGSAPAQTNSKTPSLRAFKPQVVCANYRSQRFFVRARPANCDFPSPYAEQGSISSWSVFPTRSFRWGHWGYRSAIGRGKAFMRGVGWRPARVRLSQPRTVCGRKVFTRLRVRMKPPGSGWSSWGRKVAIKTCV